MNIDALFVPTTIVELLLPSGKVKSEWLGGTDWRRAKVEPIRKAPHPGSPTREEGPPQGWLLNLPLQTGSGWEIWTLDLDPPCIRSTDKHSTSGLVCQVIRSAVKFDIELPAEVFSHDLHWPDLPGVG